MNANELTVSAADMQKLLSAASPDAALLYLYVQSGNDPSNAGQLGITPSRLSCAESILRQLGLWPEPKALHIMPGERPNYSEQDVMDALKQDRTFPALYEEVQRLMGRNLGVEELKILLGFVNYLGLPADVITVLISYCKERARRQGRSRIPGLRTIEKEAYIWAERGIDTLEEASAFIRQQNIRNSQVGRLMNILQIHGRNLTAAEEKYAQKWLDMGFDDSAMEEAYQRTCLNTGNMNWSYMNKILESWHARGLHNSADIQAGDQKKVPQGASGQLGQAEMDALRRLLQDS